MSLRFNPFTTNFDFTGSQGTGTSITFATQDKTVDSSFLTSKTLTLSGIPIVNSDFIFLNGLLLGKDCYTIINSELTFEATLPFKVGHYLDIRYAI